MISSSLATSFFRLHERLLGRNTFAILDELDESQWWPRQRLESLQLERLRDLLGVACEHTPYWADLMKRHGVHPSSIQSLDDLRRLPLLTKETIRLRHRDMAWAKASGIKKVRTSGSTNVALEFYTDAHREASISAARMRGHRWIGINPGDKELYFWAAPVEVSTQGRIKHIRDYLRNDYFSNALDLSAEQVPSYVRQWKNVGANCLFGYVSSFVLFGRIAQEAGVDLRSLSASGLRAITTTSEILGANRQVIQHAFGVPVYDSYGIREGGLLGHECPHFTMHTNDEQLILETIDPLTLEPTTGEGELVVTMLASHCMPVIRYRTGDIVTLSDEPCPCGRSLKSIRVSGGRILEFIVTSAGRWISAVAFIYVCRQVKDVLQVQARQDRPGEIRVLVVPAPNASSDLSHRVEAAVRARIGAGDVVQVELVDQIPSSPSGKQRLVISKVTQELLKAPSSGCPLAPPELSAGNLARQLRNLPGILLQQEKSWA